MMTASMKTTLLIALLPLHVFAAAAVTEPTDHAPFKAALEQHLQTQGLVCLGKFEWPIDVTENDAAAGTRDAIQMPVLEKLGVVKSTKTVTRTTDGPTDTDAPGIPGRRYTMTEVGLHSYLAKGSVIIGGATVTDERRDLCPVRLSLDKITRVDTRIVGDAREAVVSYTYKVDAAEWMRDAAARKAFPLIDRLLTGTGNQQLQQRLKSDGKAWVALAPTE